MRRHPSSSTPDGLDARLGQLKTRLAVAENSVVADVSDDWTTFAGAVEDELRSWDTYLERLQATAATKDPERARAGRGGDRRRPQPPARRRTTASHRRAPTSTAPGAGRGTTSSVARDELERKADELSAKIA